MKKKIKELKIKNICIENFSMAYRCLRFFFFSFSCRFFFSVKKCLPYFCSVGQKKEKRTGMFYGFHRPECLWGVLFKMATTTKEDDLGVKRRLKSLCEAKLSWK